MNREEFSDMAMLQVNVDLPLFSRSRQGPRIASAEAEWQALESRAEAVRREHEVMLQSDLAEYERQERTLARQREQLVPRKEKVDWLGQLGAAVMAVWPILYGHVANGWTPN